MVMAVVSSCRQQLADDFRQQGRLPPQRLQWRPQRRLLLHLWFIAVTVTCFSAVTVVLVEAWTQSHPTSFSRLPVEGLFKHKSTLSRIEVASSKVLESTRYAGMVALSSSTTSNESFESTNNREVDVQDLQEMDVVIYSELPTNGNQIGSAGTSKKQLGAVQEDGRITPLCVWTTKPAYDEALEFLVAEEDLPGYLTSDIQLHAILPETVVYYGSRQVGGGMGPDNPHGEISEMLYYVDRSALSEDIEVIVKPELEIFW